MANPIAAAARPATPAGRRRASIARTKAVNPVAPRMPPKLTSPSRFNHKLEPGPKRVLQSTALK